MLAKAVHKAEDLLQFTRNHRVEIRTGSGERQFFQLKACKRDEAIAEAEIIASTIAQASGKSVLYRLPNMEWTVAGTKTKAQGKIKKKISQMIADFFFMDDLEEEK